MPDKNPNEKHTPRVFISHVHEDNHIANILSKQLKNQGLEVWSDQFELAVGDSLIEKIKEAITPTDYLLVLLSSASVKSKWVQYELESAYSRELNARDITVLPVLLEDCEVPPLLKAKRYLDVRNDFQVGVDQLIRQLRQVPNINFSSLNWRDFEQMVANLLSEIGFHNIELSKMLEGREIDIVAQYPIEDPFGREVKETWVVEVKFYRKERIDLRTIDAMIGFLAYLPEEYKGLLVTNGQLTSTAQNFLKSKKNKRIYLRIIDGPELRQLLLKHPNIVRRHFKAEAADE